MPDLEEHDGTLLRRAVLEHSLAEPRRRHYPPVLHVGVPGQRTWTFPAGLAQEPPGPTDHALRTDVVAALLARARTSTPAPLVWLTRPGPLHVQDVDAAWLAAARAASAEAGAPLAMVVVNRTGWRDPRTGTGRTWARLRRTPR